MSFSLFLVADNSAVNHRNTTNIWPFRWAVDGYRSPPCSRACEPAYGHDGTATWTLRARPPETRKPRPGGKSVRLNRPSEVPSSVSPSMSPGTRSRPRRPDLNGCARTHACPQAELSDSPTTNWSPRTHALTSLSTGDMAAVSVRSARA